MTMPTCMSSTLSSISLSFTGKMLGAFIYKSVSKNELSIVRNWFYTLVSLALGLTLHKPRFQSKILGFHGTTILQRRAGSLARSYD
eukprot:UN01177